MATVLAANIGNTRARFGMVATAGPDDEPRLISSCEITTRQPITADEARMELAQILHDISRSDGPCGQPCDGSILSCVVPTLTDPWKRALSSHIPARPLVIGPGLRSGIKLRFNDPGEVGPDRIADAVAARATYGGPVVVVDMGTSTHIEAIDATGAFCGGIIAPGVALGARALSEAAARLPVIELRTPRRAIGRTTGEAMQAGVVLGEAARIDGLLDAVLGELGAAGEATAPQIPVVLTGHDAPAMAALLRHTAVVDEALTLRGLARIWLANQ